MGKHNKAEASQKGQVVFLGIDLSKKSFQLHGVDARGHVVLKKKLNRKALLPFVAKGESLILTGTFIQHCSPVQETG